MKIGTVGSATQDIFILYEGAQTMHLHSQKETQTFLIFEQGTKIDIPSLYYATGGGATNTAVGFKQLGLDVEAFFKIGKDDEAGAAVLSNMKQEDIGIDHIAIDDKVPTALSFIIPSIERDHIVLCHRSANKLLRQEDFPLDILKTFDYLHINPLSGRSRALLPYLASHARALNIPVATNPGRNQLMDAPEELIAALEHIDILIMNACEASYLMKSFLKNETVQPLPQPPIKGDAPRLLEHFISLNNTTFTLYDYFKEIFKKGPSIAVVTNGAEGVYVATPTMLYFYPSIQADIISCLGAGDAFTSGFIGSLALGKDLETAMHLGVINAWGVIQQLDAKQGLLTLDQLEAEAYRMGTTSLKTYPFMNSIST